MHTPTRPLAPVCAHRTALLFFITETLEIGIVRSVAVAKGELLYVDRAVAVVAPKVPRLAFVFVAAHVLQDACAALVNVDLVN